jgi:hypothetical protein
MVASSNDRSHLSATTIYNKKFTKEFLHLQNLQFLQINWHAFVPDNAILELFGLNRPILGDFSSSLGNFYNVERCYFAICSWHSFSTKFSFYRKNCCKILPKEI